MDIKTKLKTLGSVKAYTTVLVLVLILSAATLSVTLLRITAQNRLSLDRSESLTEALFYFRQNEILFRQGILEVSNAIPVQSGFTFGSYEVSNHVKAGKNPGKTSIIPAITFPVSNAMEVTTIPSAGVLYVLSVLTLTNQAKSRVRSNYTIFRRVPSPTAGAKRYTPVFRYLEEENSVIKEIE